LPTIPQLARGYTPPSLRVIRVEPSALARRHEQYEWPMNGPNLDLLYYNRKYQCCPS
jgi:hypothetical protein